VHRPAARGGPRAGVGKLLAASPRAALPPTASRLFVARTGYTGEDGFEMIVPGGAAVAFWNALLAAGVKPAGLGARDTLRLEAGHEPLRPGHGRTVSPYEAALAWTVALDEGRATSSAARAGGAEGRRRGAADDRPGDGREGRAAPRPESAHRERRGRDPVRHVLADARQGHRVRARAGRRHPWGDVRVDIRGKEVPVRVVKFPFVRDGQAQPGI
jgi:aminomethyltransferase